MAVQTCKRCGEVLPLDRDHFGNTNNRGVIGWRGVCRACMRANSAKHAAENPEQYAERRMRRSEREGESRSAIVGIDIEALRAALGGRCRYCDVDLHGGGEVDHLTPVARGGSGVRNNLTLACRDCNRAKLAKTLDEFIAWRQQRGLLVRDLEVPGEAPDVAENDTQRRTY